MPTITLNGIVPGSGVGVFYAGPQERLEPLFMGTAEEHSITIDYHWAEPINLIIRVRRREYSDIEIPITVGGSDVHIHIPQTKDNFHR